MTQQSKLRFWQVFAYVSLAACLSVIWRTARAGHVAPLACEQVLSGSEGARDTSEGANRRARVRSLSVGQLSAGLANATGLRARCAAMTRLARSAGVDETAVEQIADYGSAEQPAELRCCAASALGDAAPAAAVARLEDLARDRSPEVAEAALRALAARGDQLARDALLALARSSAGTRQVAAVAALAETGSPEATSLIATLLEQSGLRDRERLITALGVGGDPRALPLLQQLATTGQRGDPHAAIAALGDLGGAGAADTLLRLFEERPALAPSVAVALARSGDEEGKRALLEAAEQANQPATRAAALQALTALEDDEVRALMMRALNGQNQGELNVALHYFAQHADPAAVSSLAVMLQKNDLRTGHMALHALSRIDSEEARALVLATAGEGGRMGDVALQSLAMMSGGAEQARELALERVTQGGARSLQAIEVLANDSSLEARDALIRAARTGDPATSSQALAWLGQRGDPESRRTLEALSTRASSPEQRHAAIFALARAGDPGAAKNLRTVLESGDGNARAQAVYALAQLGGEEAEQSLLLASRDRDPEVASAAASSLSQVGSERALARLEEVAASADSQISMQALIGLTQAAPERAAPLIDALTTSRDPAARGRALALASSLPSDEGARIVLAGVRDSDPAVVRDALGNLSWASVAADQARAALLAITQAPHLPEDVRAQASALLPSYPAPSR